MLHACQASTLSTWSWRKRVRPAHVLCLGEANSRTAANALSLLEQTSPSPLLWYPVSGLQATCGSHNHRPLWSPSRPLYRPQRSMYGVRQVGNTDTHVHTNARGEEEGIALISHRRSKCASPGTGPFSCIREQTHVLHARPPTRAICFV